VTLVERVARSVVARGDALAVVAGEQSLSYRQLDARADAVATRLTDLPPGPIAIACREDLALVPLILGVLKAGRAYVPLEPRQPAAHVRRLLDASGAIALLSGLDAETEAAARALSSGALPWIEIRQGDPPRAAPRLPRVTDEDAAYVLFTSGTTGAPKRVRQSHANACALMEVFARRFTPDDRVAMVCGASSDAHVMDLFGALFAGATLALCPAAELGAAGLAATLATGEVSVLHATPTVARHLLDQLGERRIGGVRLVILGGEEAFGADAARIRAVFGERVTIVNGLGLTECSLVLQHELRPGDPLPPPRAPLPVGRAVAGVEVRLTTPTGEQRAPWGEGELEIRGPLAESDGIDPGPPRRYATGDLLQRHPDGTLLFVGRRDLQIKIRGHRVLPAELESALRALPGVGDAAVVAFGDAQRRALAAFVAAADGVTLSVDTLRSALRRAVPRHLEPSRLELVSELPRLATGKIDRASLAARAETSPPARAVRSAPSPQASAIALIFHDVLAAQGVIDAGREVAIDDDFFALGGHSLLALRVTSRVSQALGVEVPLSALFDAATPALLAARLAPAPHRRETGLSVAAGPSSPASFGQARLWLLDQLRSPDGPCPCNEAATLRLTGALDEPALERSLAELIRRHAILRTALSLDGGELVQRVFDDLAPPLEKLDLRALPAAEQDARIARLVAAEAQRPFDLARGPLLRLFLARLADDRHTLLFSVHHLVTDGWSMLLVVRELDRLYAAARGLGLPPPPPQFQFRDFAAWERSRLAERGDDDRRHWKQYLDGAMPVLLLPTDRPRPPAITFRGGRWPVCLPPDLVRDLMRVARREHATVSMALLAAWAILLGRYARQSDLVFGLGVTGRSRAELEEMIGFFLNVLPVRFDLAGAPDFRRVLARARTGWLGAIDHQSLPLDQIVDLVQPRRDPALHPLFQSAFVFQGAPAAPARVGDLDAQLAAVDNGVAKFDLNLALEPNADGGVGGVLEYNATLFDPETIERLVRHFAALVRALVDDPDRDVGALPLVSPEERRAIVRAAGAIATQSVEGPPLHALFAERARQSPDAVALRCDGREVTYAELERRANGLANRLRDLGAAPESRVALFLPPSIDLVVGVLGILKSGAAYVPIDAESPRPRIEFILRDSGAELLVTDGARASDLAGLPARLVEVAGPLSGGDTFRDVPGATLAYVIYTSGSTGDPKGVLVEHRMIARLFTATRPRFAFQPTDVWSLFHSIAFDFSVWEMWGALLHGGRLVIVPRQVARAPDEFFALLEREGVTILSQTPSAFAQLATVAAAGNRLGALRHVVFGGESLSPHALAPWIDRYGDEQPALTNMYGITETTVHVTARRITRADVRSHRSPIGVALPDLRAHVLEPSLEPAPDGVPGLLHIGGPGVARGYLGRPSETALRFIADPFSDTPGERLYCSGDLVRRLPGGELEYLGRVDQQVKIRGYRIEPGEIEAALLRLDGVAEALVLVSDGDSSQRRLCAYVVAKSGAQLAAGDLRARLAATLPGHLVPSAFVLLDRLPLTANGKLDRAALPKPLERSDSAVVAPPLTPTETAIARVWCEVLGIARVGIDENFFYLGGNSLLLVRVAARLRDALGVDLPVRALFGAQTIAELARLVALAPTPATPSTVPPITPRADRDTYPLSKNQEWVGPDTLAILSVHPLEGALDLDLLERSVNEVVARHEILRAHFPIVDGKPVQRVATARPIALGRHDLRPIASKERDAAALAILRGSIAGFDPTAGPLVRANVLRMADDRHLVSVTLHHLVADGSSIPIFLDELSRAYSGHRGGDPAALPSLPLQYADFAAWQRALLDGPIGAARLADWARLLDGLRALDLPLDRPRPAASTQRLFPSERLAWELPARLREPLKRLASSERESIAMVLFAAFAAELGRWSGETDLGIDVVHANRDRPGTERMIGYLAQPCVVRITVAPSTSPRALIRRVREAYWAAAACADVPPLAWLPRVRWNYVAVGAARFAGTQPWGWEPPEQLLPEKRQRFDLLLNLFDSESSLAGGLRYRSDLFDRATLEELLARYEARLRAWADDAA
jgi:amino acid adenylation domain-containing protein